MPSTLRLLALLAVPAFFYVLATFSSAKFNIQSYSTALLISVCFATAEYALKNPIVNRLSDTMSYPLIQGIWIVQTLVLSLLFQQLRLNR